LHYGTGDNLSGKAFGKLNWPLGSTYGFFRTQNRTTISVEFLFEGTGKNESCFVFNFTAAEYKVLDWAVLWHVF